MVKYSYQTFIIFTKEVFIMGLATALNNMRYDKDKFDFLRDMSPSRFSESEIDEALLMLGRNPNNYNSVDEKYRAIMDFYR
jgi:hypothetical protein